MYFWGPTYVFYLQVQPPRQQTHAYSLSRSPRLVPTPPSTLNLAPGQSGKESALVVERYGGNMMTLNAEPAVVGGGDGPVPPESELSFTTHVMKASVAWMMATHNPGTA